jgi:hypothetical protein
MITHTLAVSRKKQIMNKISPIRRLKEFIMRMKQKIHHFRYTSLKNFNIENNIFVHYFKIVNRFIFSNNQMDQSKETPSGIFSFLQSKFFLYVFIVLRLFLLIFLHFLSIYFKVFLVCFTFIILANESILKIKNEETSVKKKDYDEEVEFFEGKRCINRW